MSSNGQVTFPARVRRVLKVSCGDLIAWDVEEQVKVTIRRVAPLDASVTDLLSAGLPVPSIVRMKLFPLDHRLILG